jgi:SAM-dependent methyltransferase
MIEFWDQRYREKEYAYGEKPNAFFEEQINKLSQGVIILPCDGEGRNGVYAAMMGWQVFAFDLSQAGRVKAMELASKKNAQIHYTISDVIQADYPTEKADVVALIYAHLPMEIRAEFHKKGIGWLKPGGRIILEAFNPNQLQNSSGGPKEIGSLYSKEMLLDDFKGLKIEVLQTIQYRLDEGKYHQGNADLIQFVGVKPIIEE